MTKILLYAVVMLSALWFFPITYAQKTKHRSNVEDFDFYFDDSSLNEPNGEGNSSMAETTEFNRNDYHKNIDEPYTESIPKNISVRNLKRLLRYFVSLLHSIEANDDHGREFSNGYKFGKISNSRSTNLKTNRKNTTPVIHKDTDFEEITDTEFKNLDEGNENEYNYENISSKNSRKKTSGIKFSKPDIDEDHTVQNHDDDHKSLTELFQTGGENAKRLSSKSGQISDEFIDEYINPPKTAVLMEYDDEYISNQSIISDESEDQTSAALKEVTSEGNDYEIEDRKLIKTQNPATSRNGSKNTDSTTYTASSNQVGDLEEGNSNSVTRNSTRKYFSLNNSTIAVSDKPRSDKNYNSKKSPFSGEDTLNENSDTSEEIELPHSENSKITSVNEDTDDNNQKNFPVLVDSRKQFSTENSSLNRESEIQSKQVPNNDESNSQEQHSLTQVNCSKFEEKDNTSEEIKEQTDSGTDSDFSENSDLEESDGDDNDEYYEDIKEMSNFANNFTRILSNDTTHFTPNFSAIFTNHSKQMESPTSPLDKNKKTTLLKTKELFNSILEFLYEYSNSTWIKKFREENRRT